MPFIPESYSAQLLTELRANLVADSITNDNYVPGSGDTVHVYSAGDVAANSTNADSSVNWQSPSSSEKTMVMDQDIDVSVKVDMVDEFQSDVNIQNTYREKQRRAADEDIDTQVLGEHTNVPSANDIDTSATTVSGFHDVIRKAKVALDDQDVPDERRYLILDPFYADLAQQKVSELAITEEPILSGSIARIEGFDLFKSTRLPTGDFATSDAGSEVSMMFGHPVAITLAVEPRGFAIVTNDEQAAFHGTGLKGRVVYGSKVFKPKALGRITAPVN